MHWTFEDLRPTRLPAFGISCFAWIWIATSFPAFAEDEMSEERVRQRGARIEERSLESVGKEHRLSSEQKRDLRNARETEMRAVLGLASDVPLPPREELSEEQRRQLRAAKTQKRRTTLGLAPGSEVPDREDLSEAQRQLLSDARDERVRRVLDLPPEAPLPRGVHRMDRKRDRAEHRKNEKGEDQRATPSRQRGRGRGPERSGSTESAPRSSH
jgi:hypothetical protein